MWSYSNKYGNEFLITNIHVNPENEDEFIEDVGRFATEYLAIIFYGNVFYDKAFMRIIRPVRIW